MKIANFVSPVLVVSVVLAAVFAVQAQQTKLEMPSSIEAGGPISLHLNFDKALPDGATVRVEVSPQATTQWIAISTGEADNAERTSFTLKGRLPEAAVPGDWTVRNVWLFLPGSVQGQALGHNNGAFRVKAKDFPIPTKAEITVTK
jgi:hypothetical protein